MLLSFVREKTKSWHQHNQTECVHFTKAFKVYYQKNEWGVWKYNTDLDTWVKIQWKRWNSALDSLPITALKKKISLLEPEESSSGIERSQNLAPKRYEHRRSKQIEYRNIKVPGNYSRFACSCWGKGQVGLRMLKWAALRLIWTLSHQLENLSLVNINLLIRPSCLFVF